MHARLSALLLLVGAATLSAQVPGARREAKLARQAQKADSVRPNRANLEQQVRERMAQVTRQRLGATNEQMAKLQATNSKFDDMRRILVAQERDVRMSLRDEMLHPDSARQGQVGALLDRVIKTQRQRVDIEEQEQKELATFLTPLQRAKYFALEQQIRQRVTQMRQQLQLGRGGRMGRAGRGVQPPPPPH